MNKLLAEGRAVISSIFTHKVNIYKK